MLKDLNPLLGPDLLWVLASMGHGDDLALVDANFPGEAIARRTASGRLVRLPGTTLEAAAAAILSVLPVDGFVDDPVRRMEVVGAPSEVPPVQLGVVEAVRTTSPSVVVRGIERFAFYEAAAAAFAVVQVGDVRAYGDFLLRKGIIVPSVVSRRA